MKRKDLAIVFALWLASWGLVAALGFAVLSATSAHALTDASQVPVLYYHSRSVGPECSPDDTDVLAFERDARILREAGYTLRPLLEVVYWRLGIWSGDMLPDKVAAITVDDGFDRDYLGDIPSRVGYPEYPCYDLPSVREIAEAEAIPVTFFVIGSRAVRSLISPDYFGDNWWAEAAAHPLFTIGNHTIDHEHTAITEQIHDHEIDALLPAAGHADGVWHGQLRPERWTTYTAADLAVRVSAERIERATGIWPNMLAYPMGYTSHYMRAQYLPRHYAEHKTLAAFCDERGATFPTVTRTSDRWCLPRVGYRISWRTGDELRALLKGAWE